MFDSVDATAEETPEVELVTLDPEAVEAKVAEALGGVVGAAGVLVKSAPYGLLPDPQHMAILRDAYKRYELAMGELETTAKLIQLAQPAEPDDIQTEGL